MLPSFKVWRRLLMLRGKRRTSRSSTESSFISRANGIPDCHRFPPLAFETSGQSCTLCPSKSRRRWWSEPGSLVMRSSLIRQLNYGVPCLPHRSFGYHMHFPTPTRQLQHPESAPPTTSSRHQAFALDSPVLDYL